MRRVQEFRTSYSTFGLDKNGKRIVVAGIPSLEEHTIIIHVYFPEVSDVIKGQIDQLNDPSAWDYVLYLETTQSGRLINRLIPGSGERILNFKISLLSTALSKKATLLQMPYDDLMDTVEILHHISLRQTLHHIKLLNFEKNHQHAIELFGLNPLLESEQAEPILSRLNNDGTLFIENIDYLSEKTQKYLAEFIAFGYFHKFKSDIKVYSNVRVICSTNKDLLALVKEGKFSSALFNELNKMSLTMPSLNALTDEEMSDLVQGFAGQVETSEAYKNLLALMEKDTNRFLRNRPLSLRECKQRVHQLMANKSLKHNIQESTYFDSAYDIVEPDIADAVRLGKKALKDPQIMTLLWNKFKNQNKIATLLRVNRSSVNRRCQEYNLR